VLVFIKAQFTHHKNVITSVHNIFQELFMWPWIHSHSWSCLYQYKQPDCCLKLAWCFPGSGGSSCRFFIRNFSCQRPRWGREWHYFLLIIG